MALPVIDVTCLEGRDGELVVKDLAVAGFQSSRASAYAFKKLHSWEEVPGFNARMNCSLDRGCNRNVVDILYFELESITNRAASSAVAIYCFGPQKSEFISKLIDRTVIEISKLGCPQHAQLNFPVVTSTFPCQNKSKYFCAMRAAYAVARWFHFSVFSAQDALLSKTLINVFRCERVHF